MDEPRHRDYYVGNIPKNASEQQIRIFLSEWGEIISFEFRLESCSYCPTKVAFVMFSKGLHNKAIEEMNRKTFQEKRLFVTSTASKKYFTPLLSIVVRYLNEDVSEEDIYKYFKEAGSIECVQKPAHTYAYVSFHSNDSIKHAMEMKYRPLKGVEAYIVAVRRKISMLLENRQFMPYASLMEKCHRLGLFYDPAAENEITLLVTNIPRDTEEDELLDFLGKYGKIIDWDIRKSATCVLTNIGYVTYQHPKMARFAYLCSPLSFQGVGLEVYNHKLRYNTVDSSQAIILKRTSVYLTDDEIFETFSEYGTVQYLQRLDAANYNTIVRLDTDKAAKEAQSVNRISGEEVHIRSYTGRQYHLPMIGGPDNSLEKPPKRIRKEAALQQIIDTENRRNLLQLRTEFNLNYFNPNPFFYRNEVQVWNYPSKYGLVQFRDFFKKYGTVINLRELKPQPTSPSGVAYISFETKLEAKRVCKMNQTYMGSKRLLILMADRKIVHDPTLCLRVGNLTEEIMDEDVYDRFNMIGSVKYVFRPQIHEAVVCMVDEHCLKKASKVICVGRFPVIITSLISENNFNDLQIEATSGVSSIITSFAGGSAYPLQSIEMLPQTIGSDSQSNSLAMYPKPAEMQVPNGMVFKPLAVPVPMPNPGLSVLSMPMGPLGMGGPSPMQQFGANITPRMRGLMQAVEKKMITSKAFTTLPMPDQFSVVHEIVSHCLHYPAFLSLNLDEKIRYLIMGENGFKFIDIFTLFTYPEQLQMLSVIESYYRSTTNQGSLGSAHGEQGFGCAIPQPNTLVVLTKNSDVSLVEDDNISNVSAAKPSNNPGDDGDNDTDGDDGNIVPPAPSPPPIFIYSRSSSPLSDDASAISRTLVLNGAAQRLRESALRKRKASGSDEELLEQPSSSNQQPLQRRNPRAKQKDCKLDEGYVMTDSKIIVRNVPGEINETTIKDFFSKFGKIMYVEERKLSTTERRSSPNSKAFLIEFETVVQAIRALDMHLAIMQGRIVCVHQSQRSMRERRGYTIGVSCVEAYSEVAVCETFKSCGEIRYIRTIVKNGQEICLIDYYDPETVEQALKITYLHSGGRCKASAI